jgi:hypothetical protein
MFSLHEMSTYTADRVSVSVLMFLWNLVWTLCHGGLPETRTFSFPAVNNIITTHARTCEVGPTLALLDINC